MSLLVNPKERKVSIAVEDATVTLVLRQYTMNEYSKFMEQRYSFKHTGEVKDRSMTSRVQFIDSLLKNIYAEDADGKNVDILYIDPESEETKELTPQVPDWQKYIDASWKIATAIKLEQQSAYLESSALKN